MQIHCPVCDYGREVDLATIPPTAEFATCPKCRHRFRFRAVDLDNVDQTAVPKPAPEHADIWDAVDSLQNRWRGADSGKSGKGADEGEAPGGTSGAIPWENPRDFGYVQAFIRTFIWALVQPSAFFTSLDRRPTLLPALAFYLILGCFQYVLNVVWTSFLGNLVRDSFIQTMGEEAFDRVIGNILEDSLLTPAVLSVPFQLTIQLVLTVAMVHLLIRLVSPQTSDFSLAFKVAAYAGAGFSLVVIPIAGSIISPLWYFALLLIGCRQAFALPWNKALMVVIPLYLLLIFFATAHYSQFLGN